MLLFGVVLRLLGVVETSSTKMTTLEISWFPISIGDERERERGREREIGGSNRERDSQ